MDKNNWLRPALLSIVGLLVLLWWWSRPEPLPALAVPEDNLSEFDLNRGEYLVNISGCVSCHTDADNGGAHLAGGVKLDTPFGSYFRSQYYSGQGNRYRWLELRGFCRSDAPGHYARGSTLLPCISLYILHANPLFRPARHV